MKNFLIKELPDLHVRYIRGYEIEELAEPILNKHKEIVDRNNYQWSLICLLIIVIFTGLVVSKNAEILELKEYKDIKIKNRNYVR